MIRTARRGELPGKLMASNAADGTVIGSVLINLIDWHKENALAEASGSILAVSPRKAR